MGRGRDAPILVGRVVACGGGREPPNVQVVEEAMQHAGRGGKQQQKAGYTVVEARGVGGATCLNGHTQEEGRRRLLSCAYLHGHVTTSLEKVHGLVASVSYVR